MTARQRDQFYTARWGVTQALTRAVGAQKGQLEAALSALNGLLGGSPQPAKEAVSPLTVTSLVPSGPLPIVGRAFSKELFPRYLAGIRDSSMVWKPKGATVHHTGAPSLAQRPQGIQAQHMHNFRSWYRSLGWTHGPHLFIDEDEIWVFSPLTARGTHAVSFNYSHFGVEMLGNFDSEDPTTGRGAEVLDLAAFAVTALQRRFSLPPTSVNFHRDDPKTDKTCPGKKVTKALFAHKLAKYS